MPKPSSVTDHDILEAALSGLQTQLQQTNERIAAIRARLGHRPRRTPAATDGAGQAAPKRRTMSAAARRRIGLAQKRRWAAARQEKAEPEKSAGRERKFSMAGLKAISRRQPETIR